MAIVLKDRVKQTASAPGVGTIILGATAAGFQAFSAIGDGNVTYFAIVDPISGDWEVNYGTYTAAGTTLSRNATPLSSSNAGALVAFTGSVDVFCTYPSEKAIYEETGGNVLIDGGPITVIGSGVTTYSTFAAALGEMYANINSFAQFYAQNLNDGTEASSDFVAYNDLGDGVNNFVDMGINSSNYTSTTYPIFTPGSAYVFNDGGEMIIGSATDDLLLFAGGVATTNWALRADKTTQALTTKAGLTVGGSLTGVGGSFSDPVISSSTSVLNPANNEFVTKAYVDNATSTGIHIHTPVVAETSAALSAVYTQGGTAFNITDITGGNTVVTSTTHGLSVDDQIWLTTTAGNGLSINTPYFVYATPTTTSLQLTATWNGPLLTGLTNASGLSYATRANSGVGAYLEASANQALPISGVTTNDRVLVYNQSTTYWDGVYTVTALGSGASKWKLTRATDADYYSPSDTDGLSEGDYFFVQSNSEAYVLTTPGIIIIGYTGITYTLFSSVPVYTGTSPINVTGTTISLGTVPATNGGTGTATVTTGDLLYGSATNTWSKLAAGSAYKSLVMNAGGTNVEWNAVALNQTGAVSGSLPATNGGTGLNSYTLGDTVYSSAANTLSKLAGNTTTTKKFLVQTGTGAESAAPEWGTVQGADVSGNISGSAGSVANALTLGTYLTGTSYNGSSAITATVDATSNNTASKVVARDSSGNFSANIITASLSGAATSATTATNLANGIANQIPYQTSAGTTAFITAASGTNYVLNYNGSSFNWVAGTISGVALGSNLNSLTAGTYLTGTAYNGSAAQTFAVDATSANTASKVVARDASGNFSANIITASLNGNASTSTTTTTASNVAGTASNSVQSAYQTSINTTTPGLALYGIHFNGQTTADYASGITWNGGSSTTNAQAGIYVQGSGAYGTKMYIATTDSYATGAKTAISIDHTGLTNFVRVRPTALGNTMLDAGNYSSYALPLTGGTVSGQVYLSSNNQGVGASSTLRVNGDITAARSNGSSGVIYLGNSGNTYLFYDGSQYFMPSGQLDVNGQRVLNAGNYNNYSPTLTGSGASGTWGINVSGNAATASNASLVNGITAVQFFNNMGNVHSTYTNFNSFGDFGFRYMQGSTNGPGTGATQYYGMTLGLGSDYSSSQYGTQFYWNRTSTGGNPYVSVRFLEGGSWGAWSKIYAGYADTAGSAPANGGNSATVSSITGNTNLLVNSLAAPAFIDGLTTTNFRSTFFNTTSNGYQISTSRWNTTPSVLSSLTSYGTAIAWSGSDTQGFLALNYNTQGAMIGGGYGNLLTWTATLLHSGNYGSYALPLSGGTLSGNLALGNNALTGVSQLILNNGFSLSQQSSGNSYGQFNNWVYLPGAHGLFSSVNGAHILPNDASGYGSWRMIGSRNSYNGISFDANNGSVVLMVNNASNDTGFYNSSYGWQMLWSGGTAYVFKNTYGGGTQATVLDSSNYGSYAPTLTGSGASGTWGINISGSITSQNPQLAAATESNEIGVQAPSYTSGQVTKPMYFNWYGNYWAIGNVRGGSTDSLGFGICYGNNTPIYTFTTTGLGINTTTSSYWTSPWKAVQMGGSAAVAGSSYSVFRSAALSVNAAGSSSTNPLIFAYIESARSGLFQILPTSGTTNCSFFWRGGASGTAGSTVSWTTPMTLDASGYLLIGYTSSNGAYPLQVNGQIFATSSTIATSDARYKENVQSLDGALDVIKALRPVQFNWKKHDVHNFNTDVPTVGFLAQEVQQVLADKPYLNSIVKSSDCVLEAEEKDENDNVIKEAVTEEFLGIAESNLIALLTRAMQEQNEEVVDLRARVATLEALVLNLTGN